jgi:hypothetical protein
LFPQVRVWETTAPNLKKVDKHMGKVKQVCARGHGASTHRPGKQGRRLSVWSADSCHGLAA